MGVGVPTDNNTKMGFCDTLKWNFEAADEQGR